MRLRTVPLLTAFALLWLLPLPDVVADAEDLFDARVEVVGQGEAARAEGFREALGLVLVRVTGTRMVLEDPEAEEVLDGAARYVESFRYSAIDDEPDEADADSARDEDDGEEAPTHYLEVSFSDARLEHALRDREISLWGMRRPEVLVWLGVDDGRDRVLVGEGGDDEAGSQVRKLARERGLPVLFPLLDTEDMRRIDFIDIRGGFLDAIEHASERYRPDAMLVGHLAQVGDAAWQAEWTLIGPDDSAVRWEVRGRDLGEAIAGGMHSATDRLAMLMIGHDDEHHEIVLRVEAVDTLADYAGLAGYLDDLTGVQYAKLLDVAGDTVRFRVSLQGGVDALERLIAGTDRLVRVAAPVPRVPPSDSATRELDELVDSLLDENGGHDRTPEPASEVRPVPELVYRLAS